MTAALPSPAFWRNKRVLLTGHTGFKGSWAALWLVRMGAQVTGFAPGPNTVPALFVLGHVDRTVHRSVICVMPKRSQQRSAAPILKSLFIWPPSRSSGARSGARRETFATNVMGTVHLLDALRRRAGSKSSSSSRPTKSTPMMNSAGFRRNRRARRCRSLLGVKSGDRNRNARLCRKLFRPRGLRVPLPAAAMSSAAATMRSTGSSPT